MRPLEEVKQKYTISTREKGRPRGGEAGCRRQNVGGRYDHNAVAKFTELTVEKVAELAKTKQTD